MIGTSSVRLALCAIAFAVGTCAWGQIVLSDNGETEYVIVLAEEASAPERFAAGELQEYLRRICGATFSIESGPTVQDRPALIVGTPESNPLIGQQAETITFSAHEREYDSFIIRTHGEDLILAGANPRSCLYAVYGFLEEDLGVFWPSVFHSEEIIPKRETIRLDSIDRQETASFRYRGYTRARLRTLDLMGKRKMNFAGVPYGLCDDDEAWTAYRGELGKRGIKTYSSHHGFHYFLPPDELFDDHPEYYSLRPAEGGMERKPKQFCTSNPEALNLYAGRFLDFMERHPEVEIFCPGPEDGYSWCMCPLCGDEPWQVKPDKQFGSDRLMKVVNAVARGAEQRFPDRSILYFGYVATGEVPKREKPLDNVITMLAFFERCASDLTSSAGYYHCEDIEAYYRNNIQEWTQLVPEVIIYEYYCGRGSWHARPFAKTTNMKNSLRYLADNDVKGLISQGNYNWWRSYLTNHYLLGTLLWNVDTDVDAALKTFCDRRYGPAGPGMFDYFDHLDGGELDRCRTDLEVAESHVADENTARLVHHQQTLLGWRQLYDGIADRYRQSVELLKAGKRSEALTLYQQMLQMEQEAQEYIDRTRLQTVLNRPAGFYVYSEILRDRYNLDEQAGATADMESQERHRQGVSDRDAETENEIVITAEPPLPVANLVRNNGFEQPLHFPAGEGIGDPIRAWEPSDTGDADGVTDEEAHSGEYSYRFVGDKKLTKNIRQRHLGRTELDQPLKKGTEMACSGWSKCTGADPRGGHYSLTTRACGRYFGGPHFTKATHDWEYAENAFELTEDVAELNSVYVLYYEQTGTAYFDDIFLGVGATDLTFNIALPDLKRITVADETGTEVFDSGPLSPGTDSFENTVHVPTRHTYTVRAGRQNGEVYVRSYPEAGTRLDLARMYAGSEIDIETTMAHRNPNFPQMGPAAVFDGTIAFGSGVYADTGGKGTFELILDRPRMLCRIGIALKPGSPESAIVSVLTDDGPRTIRRYEHADTETIDMVPLSPPVTITGVRIEITDCPGLAALTELQLFEDPGVVRVADPKLPQQKQPEMASYRSGE